MPSDVPYMMSVKNLPAILAKVREAGTPPKFTSEFLKGHLGFPSSNDRGVIKVFKQLGFLTADGSPTARYNDFRNEHRSRQAMAAGLREGWPDIFLADQKAHSKSSAELTQLFKNVTGKGESVAVKMASTFKGLANAADWSTPSPQVATGNGEEPGAVHNHGDEALPPSQHSQLKLHHDVHIHLPATSDQAVYSAIFRALREELLD